MNRIMKVFFKTSKQEKNILFAFFQLKKKQTRYGSLSRTCTFSIVSSGVSGRDCPEILRRFTEIVDNQLFNVSIFAYTDSDNEVHHQTSAMDNSENKYLYLYLYLYLFSSGKRTTGPYFTHIFSFNKCQHHIG